MIPGHSLVLEYDRQPFCLIRNTIFNRHSRLGMLLFCHLPEGGMDAFHSVSVIHDFCRLRYYSQRATRYGESSLPIR